MPSGSRIVLTAVAAIVGVCLAALGALGVVLLSLLLARSPTLTPLSTGLLVLSLCGFGAATACGAWTLIDLIRGRIEPAKRARHIDTWLILAATASWVISAVLG